MKKKLEKLFPILIIILFIVINLVRNMMSETDTEPAQKFKSGGLSTSKGSAPIASVNILTRYDMIGMKATTPIPNEIPLSLTLSYYDLQGDVASLEAEFSDGQKFKTLYPPNFYSHSFKVKSEGRYSLRYKVTDSADNVFFKKIDFDVVQTKLPASDPQVDYIESKDTVFLDFSKNVIPGDGFRKVVVNFNDGSKPVHIKDMRLINRNSVVAHKFPKPGTYKINVNYLRENYLGLLAESVEYEIAYEGNITKNINHTHYAPFTVSKAQKGQVELTAYPQIDPEQIRTLSWSIRGGSDWDIYKHWLPLLARMWITHDPVMVFKLKKGVYIFELEVVDKDGNVGRTAQSVRVP